MTIKLLYALTHTFTLISDIMLTVGNIVVPSKGPLAFVLQSPEAVDPHHPLL